MDFLTFAGLDHTPVDEHITNYDRESLKNSHFFCIVSCKPLDNSF